MAKMVLYPFSQPLTFLLPHTPSGEDDQLSLEPIGSETDFNFITHCFFLTHRTLTLGVCVCVCVCETCVPILCALFFRDVADHAEVCGPHGTL